jgi:hypothetical protein
MPIKVLVPEKDAEVAKSILSETMQTAETTDEPGDIV